MSEWTCTKRTLSSATECLWLLILPGLGFGQTLISQQAEILTSPRSSTAQALLFSYVTAAAGFDTQITISNTSADTEGSTPLSGTCRLYYYGVQVTCANSTPADSGRPNRTRQTPLRLRICRRASPKRDTADRT